MENLAIKAQDAKGGEFKNKENLGYVTTFINHSEDYIVVDSFEGAGDNYKKREQTEIRVYDNGRLIFKGTKREFFNQLSK